MAADETTSISYNCVPQRVNGILWVKGGEEGKYLGDLYGREELLGANNSDTREVDIKTL